MPATTRHRPPTSGTRRRAGTAGAAGVAGAAVGAAAVGGALLLRRVVAVARGGHGHSLRVRALDAAAGVLQPKRPLEAVSTHLNGFHFYADEPDRQVEATHLCSHRRPGLHQCVIYDSDAPDARLIGVEYIVGEEAFRALPEEEKRLWHSHRHEVRSGTLVAPGVPEVAEHAHVEHLAGTYGKTFHTWQYDRDEEVPLGVPRLMMAFTGDGQLREDLLRARDERLGTSAGRKRRQREGIAVGEPVPGADAWEGGTTPQLRAEEVPVRHPGSGPSAGGPAGPAAGAG
ncbi:OBAP family protein [Quadrisphaera sp. KR29]|uniref:OBAP family protein n=1 Tax=Quadrisphaera sp. KR29 TaxID=3461391 RepID=UPI0040448678